ncbi:MAG: hypothetical protein AAFV07_05520 [Bacteroidota bacterium]
MRYIIAFLILGFLTSCSLGERIFGLPDNPESRLDLKLTYFTQDDTIAYTVREIVEEQSVNQANTNTLNTIGLIKSLVMTAVSDAGDSIEFELWLYYQEKPKTEEGELQIDGDTGEWDYVDQEREVEDFFLNESTRRRVIIQRGFVSFEKEHSVITKTRKVEVDGQEQTWIEMDLNGEAYGWFGPGLLPYFEFEGSFEGVIE